MNANFVADLFAALTAFLRKDWGSLIPLIQKLLADWGGVAGVEAQLQAIDAEPDAAVQAVCCTASGDVEKLFPWDGTVIKKLIPLFIKLLPYIEQLLPLIAPLFVVTPPAPPAPAA